MKAKKPNPFAKSPMKKGKKGEMPMPMKAGMPMKKGKKGC